MKKKESNSPHLRRVQNASTGNVDFDTTVKAKDTLITIHIADERGERQGLFRVGLRQGLQDVKGVTDKGTPVARGKR